MMDALTAYEKPRELEREVWNGSSPYFFPEDHALYDSLESIFKKRRVTLSLDSLKRGGFSRISQQPFTKMTTAVHDKLPGLFFKIYLDAQKPYKRKPEYDHWQSRIKGSQLIKKFIAKNEWEDTFKVPQKWMYPLPLKPMPTPPFKGVFFVLVEEDMDLVPFKENLQMWKSPLITEKVLDRLYTLITSLGLSDCITPKNLPFSKDGKIAFIDTQTYMNFPINTRRLSSYLTDEARAYWEKLTKKQIPKKPPL